MPGAEGEAAPRAVALHSAEIPCEVCGRSTPHRIVHIDRGGKGTLPERRKTVRGLARCRVCDTTHPFSIPAPPPTVKVTEILSDGVRSQRRLIELPVQRRVQVGTGLPGSEVAVVVRAIDLHDRHRASEARAHEISTVWVERERDPSIPVSIIEGRHTRSIRMPVRKGVSFEVGSVLRIDGVEIRVVRIRARGNNFERPGLPFLSEEIQRLYGRRNVRPPAGSRPWSRERESPDSRASSTSRSARSRSSPGANRNRSSPRARTALSGATDHSSAPS